MNNVYFELSERNLELINEISEITDVDYELKRNLISAESLMSVVKDLKYEIGKLQEKIEDLEEKNDYNAEHEIPNVHYDNMMESYLENR